MSEQKIRPAARCVFLNEEKILVKQCFDAVENHFFYRPLGGGIEFGEHSADAMVREIKEELGANITDLNLLGILENRFTFKGVLSHRIEFIYTGAFVDKKLYALDEIPVDENGEQYVAVWKPLSFFIAKEGMLYPEGLLALLTK